MRHITLSLTRTLAFAIAVAMTAGPAIADKPPWAGGGKGEDREHGKGKDRDRDERGGHKKHFDDRHRSMIHDYYDREYHAGHCPPGLAKKHNGCMPPGQAKKWRVGRPLPRDVVIYDLPPALVIKIGTPPVGQKYVRIASDILLIAVGTRMVVDAIDDLGRRK